MIKSKELGAGAHVQRTSEGIVIAAGGDTVLLSELQAAVLRHVLQFSGFLEDVPEPQITDSWEVGYSVGYDAGLDRFQSTAKALEQGCPVCSKEGCLFR